MNHSTWDLEVHAREMQQRRQREADRARQIEAACQRGDRMRVSPTRFGIARFMTAFRDRLSLQRRSITGDAAPAVVETPLLPMRVPESGLIADSRPAALSQPYAGMVILARGKRAQPTAQPCAAGDC